VNVNWSPAIDSSRFVQGAISDPMWQNFRGLVVLCHYVEHWRETAHSLRTTTRPPASIYKESNYVRNKRVDDWKRPIEEYEARMRRDAYLADENIERMAHLAASADEGTPDWKLAAAVVLLWKSQGHTRARYKSIAFAAFDGVAQLIDSDPRVIANRWLANSGYPPV
jgi:hypothetical protein